MWDFATFRLGFWDLMSSIWDLGMGICEFINWDLGIFHHKMGFGDGDFPNLKLNYNSCK